MGCDLRKVLLETGSGHYAERAGLLYDVTAG
jgi:hypothetical protein